MPAFVWTLIKEPFGVVSDRTFHTTREKIKKKRRVPGPIEVLSDSVVMFERIFSLSRPNFLIGGRKFLRMIDDQAKEVGQRFIQIVNPVCLCSVPGGARNGNRLLSQQMALQVVPF